MNRPAGISDPLSILSYPHRVSVAAPISRPRLIASALPSDRLLWGALAATAAIVPPWEHLVAVNIQGLSQIMAIVAAILLLRAGYVMRRPHARIIHTLLENGAGIIAYTAILAPVSYLCARNSLPLFNDAFNAADLALGYDWHFWADLEDSIPAVSLLLRIAYASMLPQTVFVLILLPVIGDGQRGFSFIRASLIAAIIACAGSYAMPAAMPEAVDTAWYGPWSALRTTAPFSVSLSQVEGIITFPSFHAAVAVLLLYAVRGLGLVTIVFGVAELLMLISTTTYGHHYFCDVLAGIVVAVGAIWLTSHLDRRFPATRPPDRGMWITQRPGDA